MLRCPHVPWRTWACVSRAIHGDDVALPWVGNLPHLSPPPPSKPPRLSLKPLSCLGLSSSSTSWHASSRFERFPEVLNSCQRIPSNSGGRIFNNLICQGVAVPYFAEVKPNPMAFITYANNTGHT